jgi:hypothetical protein
MIKNQHMFGINSFHNFDSRLLFITDNVAFLEWLREAAPEYELRITPNLILLNGWVEMDNNTCSKFKLYNGQLTENDNVDPNTSSMNRLCTSWADNYRLVVKEINHQRRHLGSVENFNFQDVVYQAKFKEAQAIVNGHTEDLKFLNLEAIYKNITLEELAHRVILENEVHMGYLARTEFLRVKWLSTLQQSRNIEDHKTIRKEFLRELYEYHFLS